MDVPMGRRMIGTLLAAALGLVVACSPASPVRSSDAVEYGCTPEYPEEAPPGTDSKPPPEQDLEAGDDHITASKVTMAR